MFTIPYIETEERFFYLDVFLKLLLGLLALALIINKSGKGNLAPTSAMDQVQNYVLGGVPLSSANKGSIISEMSSEPC